MLAVLEHLDPGDVLSTLRRLWLRLAPGGYLIITTPPTWTLGLLQKMASAGLVSRREIAEHKRQYSPGEVCTLLYEAGFDRDSIDWSYYDLWTNMWFVARRTC